jgi:hypothetical protein
MRRRDRIAFGKGFGLGAQGTRLPEYLIALDSHHRNKKYLPEGRFIHSTQNKRAKSIGRRLPQTAQKPALDHTPDCRKTAFPSVHYEGGVADALSPAGLFSKAGYIGGRAY